MVTRGACSTSKILIFSSFTVSTMLIRFLVLRRPSSAFQISITFSTTGHHGAITFVMLRTAKSAALAFKKDSGLQKRVRQRLRSEIAFLPRLVVKWSNAWSTWPKTTIQLVVMVGWPGVSGAPVHSLVVPEELENVLEDVARAQILITKSFATHRKRQFLR